MSAWNIDLKVAEKLAALMREKFPPDAFAREYLGDKRLIELKCRSGFSTFQTGVAAWDSWKSILVDDEPQARGLQPSFVLVSEVAYLSPRALRKLFEPKFRRQDAIERHLASVARRRLRRAWRALAQRMRGVRERRDKR